MKPCGRSVLSIDNKQQTVIDHGNQQIIVYSDKPEEITTLIVETGLTIGKQFEIDFAVIFMVKKEV